MFLQFQPRMKVNELMLGEHFVFGHFVFLRQLPLPVFDTLT